MPLTLKRKIWINASVAIVHSYFTDGAKMNQWTGQACEIDARPGGIYRLDMGQGGVLEGRFTEVSARRICWEVNIPESRDVSRIEVAFSAEAGGTLLEINHHGLPMRFGLIAERGWDHHLARLSVVATGADVGRDSLCDRSLQSLE